MANTNAPRGLMPYQLNGEPKVQEYSIASEYGVNLARGDVVELTGTGRNIALAAAGNTDNLGVFWGVSWVDSQGSQHFGSMWPASTAASSIKAAVVPFDMPAQVFEVQCDTLVEANVGLLVDWAAGTLDTVNGQSGLYADLTSGTSATGMSLRIVGLVDRVDNAYGQYAKARVNVVESIFYLSGNGVD